MERLGRYEIIAELGRGAMGTVYRARDPKIDRVVALKTITVAGVGAADEEEYRQRFFREAQAAGKLSHGGLVTIHDVGEDEATRTPFIVMEYVEGKTLEELGRGERLPVKTALELVKQVAEGLDYAHSRKITHRDIKPANIIVTGDGRAKITDFGIAKQATTQMTQAGQILGTPAYMSPEQLSGEAVDGRSDLFSLGVVLYWLLTGEKPFAGDNLTTVSFKIAYKDPVPVTQLNSSLPSKFNHALNRALAKDPARRYQTGREMADDLEDLVQQRPPRSLKGPAAGAAAEQTVVHAPPMRVPRGERGAARQLFSLGRQGVNFIQSQPRKLLVAAALGILVLAALLASFWGPSGPTANLTIQCQHSFQEAELTVWVDGGRVYRGELTGTVRERFGGLVKEVGGSLAKVVEVPAGKHTVRVRVEALDEGYDQTKEIEAEFPLDGRKTLAIGFGKKGRSLYLNVSD